MRSFFKIFGQGSKKEPNKKGFETTSSPSYPYLFGSEGTLEDSTAGFFRVGCIQLDDGYSNPLWRKNSPYPKDFIEFILPQLLDQARLKPYQEEIKSLYDARYLTHLFFISVTRDRNQSYLLQRRVSFANLESTFKTSSLARTIAKDLSTFLQTFGRLKPNLPDDASGFSPIFPGGESSLYWHIKLTRTYLYSVYPKLRNQI